MPVPVSSALALRCLVGTKCYSITLAVSITAEQPQFTRESSENSPPPSPPSFPSLLHPIPTPLICPSRWGTVYAEFAIPSAGSQELSEVASLGI